MLPPSATLGVALRLTVVASTVSVTVVTAGVVSTTRPMPPPLVLAMLALTELGSTYTSSLAASGTLTVPLVAPAAIVMTAPLLSVTCSALTGACVIDAV